MFNLLINGLALMPQSQEGCCGGMAQFAGDPAFRAAHIAPLALNYKPEKGRMIEFPASDGSMAKAFWTPTDGGSKSAIVLIHEWWGLNDWIKKTAEQLHTQTGFAVLAVDLYDGKIASNAEDASKLMQSVNDKRARAILKGAILSLKNGKLMKAQKIGTMGWCFGGGWAHQAALIGGPDVQACVIYYGMPELNQEKLASLKAPVLMIHAKQDKWINDSVVASFKKAMSAVKKSLTVREYNADHAFANPSNPKHDRSKADDAWKQTLSFLKKQL